MQVRRDEAVLEHQRCFDQPGYARAGFEVPDVGFHRPDQQRAGRWAFCGERIRESPDLDRVAHRSAGAVCLHIADFVGVKAGSSDGCRDSGFLGLRARNGDAIGVAVLGHRCAQDLRVDFVTVAERLVQGLDDDDSATFASGVPVGGLIEGLAPSVRREEPALRFRDRGVGSDHDVDAAGERQIAFTVPDT